MAQRTVFISESKEEAKSPDREHEMPRLSIHSSITLWPHTRPAPPEESDAIIQEKLLQFTANPNEENIEKAMAIIKKNPHLILKKQSFTEELCGQREWTKPISPLQYTAWAGDSHLMGDYLRCLPPLDKKAKQEALLQLEDLQENGIQHGKPLSVIYRLIDAYKTHSTQFISYMNGSFKKDLQKERHHHEITEIGKNQRNSVVCFIQSFCSPLTHDRGFERHHDIIMLTPVPYLVRDSLLAADSLLGASFYLCKGFYNRPDKSSYRDDRDYSAALAYTPDMSHEDIFTEDRTRTETFCKTSQWYLNVYISELKQELRLLQRNDKPATSKCSIM